MDVQNKAYLSIEQLTDRYLGSAKKAETPKTLEGLSFQQILDRKTTQETGGNLRFSKHALGRLSYFKCREGGLYIRCDFIDCEFSGRVVAASVMGDENRSPGLGIDAGVKAKYGDKQC